MARDDYENASDVWPRSHPLFGEKVSFEKAFPEIADMRVELELVSHGIAGAYESRTRHYTRVHQPGEYIDCQNPRCYNGGFSLGQILREMVREGQTELDTRKRCHGYEGSPKGRRKYRDCINSRRIRVTLTYKPDATTRVEPWSGPTLASRSLSTFIASRCGTRSPAVHRWRSTKGGNMTRRRGTDTGGRRFSQERVEEVWEKARKIPGKNPDD